MPIIVCSVRNSDQEVVAALHRGADDYVTKPFNPDVLLARVEANLRKAVTQEAGEPTLENGRIRIGSGTARSVYTVQASINGMLKKRTVTVGKYGLNTAHIRFPVKDESADEKEVISSLKQRMNTDGLKVDEVFNSEVSAKK